MTRFAALSDIHANVWALEAVPATPRLDGLILDMEANSAAWTADFRQVDYDWGAAARAAKAQGRSDWAQALRTGRVKA